MSFSTVGSDLTTYLLSVSITTDFQGDPGSLSDDNIITSGTGRSLAEPLYTTVDKCKCYTIKSYQVLHICTYQN